MLRGTWARSRGDGGRRGAQGTRGLGTAQACGPLSNVTACSPALLSFPEDLEGGPPSKKMKLEASQQSSEEM